MKLKKENIEQTLNIAPVSGSLYNYSEKDVRTNTKVPIKRGCPNKQCFCTGKCQEVIGWLNKLPNEFMEAEQFKIGIPYQLCPKCYGDGNLLRYNSPAMMSTTIAPTCDVCYGNKIILMSK